MGPGDPFKTIHTPIGDDRLDPPAIDSETGTSVHSSYSPTTDMKLRYMLLGFLFGALFGASVLTFGWGNTLLIGLCGGVGLLAALILHELANGRFDVRAAWHALRNTR